MRLILSTTHVDKAGEPAKNCVGALTEKLRALHPYDVPEIIVLDVHGDEGNLDYVNWVRKSVE